MRISYFIKRNYEEEESQKYNRNLVTEGCKLVSCGVQLGCQLPCLALGSIRLHAGSRCLVFRLDRLHAPAITVVLPEWGKKGKRKRKRKKEKKAYL